MLKSRSTMLKCLAAIDECPSLFAVLSCPQCVFQRRDFRTPLQPKRPGPKTTQKTDEIPLVSFRTVESCTPLLHKI